MILCALLDDGSHRCSGDRVEEQLGSAELASALAVGPGTCADARQGRGIRLLSSPLGSFEPRRRGGQRRGRCYPVPRGVSKGAASTPAFAAALLLLIWATIVVHFLAFPMLADRFFIASYLTCFALCLELLPHHSSMRRARAARSSA